MRLYQPIWIQLKTDLACSLQAPVLSHPTIIANVSKEKWKDTEWRFLVADRKLKYQLKTESKGELLTLTLEKVHVILNTL